MNSKINTGFVRVNYLFDQGINFPGVIGIFESLIYLANIGLSSFNLWKVFTFVPNNAQN